MKWLAFGTGIGIEVAGPALKLAVARVRPSGVDLVGVHTIENYRDRPAAEWGAEYAAFLKRHGAGHLTAVVALPRNETIVRVLSMPGVSGQDLESALALQVDTLHPYPEGEAAYSWAKLGANAAVLVGLCRIGTIAQHAERMAEAGIKVSSFSFSAALFYSALRIYGAPPSEGFAGLLETATGIEVYGESPARPVYSANFEQSPERAAAVAVSELRLSSGSATRKLAEMLPSPRQVSASGPLHTHTIAYLAALASACPRMALPVNLLPVSQRSQSSRLIYVPTVALGTMLIAGFLALGLYSRYEDQKYLDLLNAEIGRLEPKAKLVSQLDKRINGAREQIKILDEFQGRTKTDMDALREVTRLVPPPAWLNTLELTRAGLVVAGEAEQATGLLKSLDSSTQFRNSEFLVPLSRVGNVEVFRIRSTREGGPQ